MTHRHRFPLVILIVAGLLAGCAGSQNRPMQLLSGAGPIYPIAAKAEGIEGNVVVRYGVTIDGRVINARVDSAEPPGLFEEAALTAVRSWRYNPALRDGEPVGVDNVVSVVHFKLGGSSHYADY